MRGITADEAHVLFDLVGDTSAVATRSEEKTLHKLLKQRRVVFSDYDSADEDGAVGEWVITAAGRLALQLWVKLKAVHI